MLSPCEKFPKPTLGLSRPITFPFDVKRTICVTITAGCLAVAPVGVSHRVMAQIANPSNEDAFETMDATARFLTQATFGPNPNEVMALTGSSPSQWLLAEFEKETSLNLPIVVSILAQEAENVGCVEEGENGEGEEA